MGDLLDDMWMSEGGVGSGWLEWWLVGGDIISSLECWDGDGVIVVGRWEDGIWVDGEVGLGGGMALGG